MKIVCLVAAVVMLCCSCVPLEKPSHTESQEMMGVWISFSEINEMLTRDFKGEFGRVLENCEVLGITDLFVHTRAFADSLFPSKYFPLNEKVSGYEYDVLGYMISECHKKGLRFHAWINPYRIAAGQTDIAALPEENIARVWLSDSNTENDNSICIYDGVYFNPASYEVRKLIINGIREIVGNYDVDGIHFDDYFYPTAEISFDELSYAEYAQSSANPLALEDWRRANVNALISGSYTAIKFIDKNIVFSISPAASVEKNYNQYFADVSAWVKSGCVDVIIPQLYFGFEYPDAQFQFENLLSEWVSLVADYECRLNIGLATYKIGTKTEPDCYEWQNDSLIARQVELCLATQKVEGYTFFSYSSLFSEEELNAKAREKIMGIKKELA